MNGFNNTCKIDGSKVVFDIDGKTRHFTLDAGSEIIYYAMHYFTHEQIVESFEGFEQTVKLLQYLPGYKPKMLEHKESICPTCNRPL